MENELRHYGVLGMKWGVRRNSSKTYAKASKKLSKLDKKVCAACICCCFNKHEYCSCCI